MTATAGAVSPWETGRFDARRGRSQVLFGRMYEDAAVELGAFRPGGRIFCIASAGCTAMRLAARHDVVAVDVNPAQIAYARQRLAGAAPRRGAAERLLAFGRALLPLAGWDRSRVRAFLALSDPDEQLACWRRQLDTRRFRAALDGLFSLTALRRIYAAPLLAGLPPRLGAVLRRRMERCFARHANRTNPYARALLLGEIGDEPVPAVAPVTGRDIRLVEADAASYLESEPALSFDGFTLSNILDGAPPSYERRLFAAVKRAARPGATVVVRSFREPGPLLATNRALDDRAMLWGVVDVRSASAP